MSISLNLIPSLVRFKCFNTLLNDVSPALFDRTIEDLVKGNIVCINILPLIDKKYKSYSYTKQFGFRGFPSITAFEVYSWVINPSYLPKSYFLERLLKHKSKIEKLAIAKFFNHKCLVTDINLYIDSELDKLIIEFSPQFELWFYDSSKPKFALVSDKEIENMYSSIKMHKIYVKLPTYQIDHIYNKINSFKSTNKIFIST